MDILQAGGNAFDAAIAATFAACVCESASISLGGGGFMLAHTANGRNVLYDFFTQTPKSKLSESKTDFYPVTINFKDNTQDFHIGRGSMAAPGIIAGTYEVHKALCKMPFFELAQPALKYAKSGVKLDGFQHHLMELLQPILMEAPESKAAFLQANGQPKPIGELVHLPYLDDALYVLAHDGMREFYEGEIAQRLVDDCLNNGGHLRMDDLRQYRVVERPPLNVNYRGRAVLTNPPPSSGGLLIAVSLRLLSSLSFRHIPYASAEHLDVLARTMQLTNELRAKYLNGSSLPDTAKKLLADEQMLAEYADLLRLQSGKSGNTTQISVIDAKGNAASITISSGEGAGCFIPNTGIMMNNMLGEADLNPDGFHAWQPDVRISSSMAPSMILHQDKPQIVLGSGGANRIRTAILQVISNLLDYDMHIEQAVEASRIHAEAGQINMEAGFNPDEIKRMTALPDWERIVWQNKNMYFGGVHAVVRTPAGDCFGTGDGRRNGVVLKG